MGFCETKGVFSSYFLAAPKGAIFAKRRKTLQKKSSGLWLLLYFSDSSRTHELLC